MQVHKSFVNFACKCSAPPLDWILLALASVYAGRVAFFLVGVERERRRRLNIEFFPSVSVIIPARNELANLERCLRSVSRVEYPSERLEIIVIDDRSDDGTSELLDRLASEIPVVSPLHRTEDDVDPKPQR